jgi:hypothetical protein
MAATLASVAWAALYSPATVRASDDGPQLRGSLGAEPAVEPRQIAPAADLRGSIREKRAARWRAPESRRLPRRQRTTPTMAEGSAAAHASREGDLPRPRLDAQALQTGALRASPGTGPTSHTVAAIVVGAGYTSNAGPALDKTASPVLRTSADVAHKSRAGDGEFALTAAMADREFLNRSELSNYDYKIDAKWTGGTGGDGRWTAGFSSEKRVDIDEALVQSGGFLEYEWKRGTLTPFIRLSAYYLDYADFAGDFLEFGNQDDRDRLSATALAGAKYGLTDALSLKFGAGIDLKRYRSRVDDFGIERDSSSAFPFAGLAYQNAGVAIDIFYAPVYRQYREAQFTPLLAHTATARSEIKLNANWKIFAATRLGLEETDFLAAKAIREWVVSLGGVVTTPGGSSLGAEVVYTLRDFVDFDRIDQKAELVIRGRTPLANGFFLTAEAKYLDFTTSFGSASTDMLLATLGVGYEISK